MHKHNNHGYVEIDQAMLVYEYNIRYITAG